MSDVVVHGMAGSSNVQTVLMALAEKGVAYVLKTEPDFRAYKCDPYLSDLHPFGMVPAFEHGDFRLYETQAILRYVAEAFPGPTLQPEDLRRRARMNQILSVVHSYFPGTLSGGGGINFHRMFAPRFGAAPDEAAIARAIPKARMILNELEKMEGPYLVGGISIADLMAAPVIFVFDLTPEGQAMLPEFPKVAAWLEHMTARPSGALMQAP